MLNVAQDYMELEMPLHISLAVHGSSRIRISDEWLLDTYTALESRPLLGLTLDS